MFLPPLEAPASTDRTFFVVQKFFYINNEWRFDEERTYTKKNHVTQYIRANNGTKKGSSRIYKTTAFRVLRYTDTGIDVSDTWATKEQMIAVEE